MSRKDFPAVRWFTSSRNYDASDPRRNTRLNCSGIGSSGGHPACRGDGASRPAEQMFEQQRNKATKGTCLNFVSSLLSCSIPFDCFRAAGRQPATADETSAATYALA